MTETESKWTERVREWRAGGLSAPEYAKGRGFEASTLRWWASRLDRGVLPASPAKPKPQVRMARIVRVRASNLTTDSLTVRVGSARVDVRPGFDPGLLRELVAALGSEP